MVLFIAIVSFFLNTKSFVVHYIRYSIKVLVKVVQNIVLYFKGLYCMEQRFENNLDTLMSPMIHCDVIALPSPDCIPLEVM